MVLAYPLQQIAATATTDGRAGATILANDADKTSRNKAATPAGVAKQVTDLKNGLAIPAAATQAEVDTGTVANKYVSPATLKQAAGSGGIIKFTSSGTLTVQAGDTFLAIVKGGGGGGGASGLCRSSSATNGGGGGAGGGSVENISSVSAPTARTITCIVGAGGAGGVGQGYTSSYWSGQGGRGGGASRITGFDMPLLSGGGGGGGGGRVANNAGGNGSGGGGGAGTCNASASQINGANGSSGISPGGSDQSGTGKGGDGGGASKYGGNTDNVGGNNFSPAPGPFYGGDAIPNNSGGVGLFASGREGGGDGAPGTGYGEDGASGGDGADGYIILIKLN